MTLTLSLSTYWQLLRNSTKAPKPGLDSGEHCWIYPTAIAEGFCREFRLRPGLNLDIDCYQAHREVHIKAQERSHPLEISFYLTGGYRDRTLEVSSGEYAFYGSGIAPEETCQWTAGKYRVISIHVNPELLGLTDNSPLHHLIRPNQGYYGRSGQILPAMQTALHQILQAPYAGVAQRFYLEGKVLELVGQVLAVEQQISTGERPVALLKPEDCDRIVAARDILMNQMDHPPSLVALARQVGLNECTLKRGFRQVFGTTAFGYLHQHRLEQAQQLLASGDFNVSEVARRIGFTSRSHFARAFRRQFGVNPGAYARSSRSP